MSDLLGFMTGEKGAFAKKSPEPTSASAAGAPLQIKTSLLRPDPTQPRKDFDAEELKSLQDSLQELGMSQPITVVRDAGHYRIVMGERRWRAAKGLKWATVPCLLMEEDDATRQFARQVTENTHRANLSHVERAAAIQRLKDEGKKAAEIARLLGVAEATISNYTALSEAPPAIAAAVENGRVRDLSTVAQLSRAYSADADATTALLRSEEPLNRATVKALVDDVGAPAEKKPNGKAARPKRASAAKGGKKAPAAQEAVELQFSVWVDVPDRGEGQLLPIPSKRGRGTVLLATGKQVKVDLDQVTIVAVKA